MRSVEFHPDAQDEFVSAAQFYESQTEGLGLDFILTVQRTYEQLLEFPAVVAVIHLHRRPGYWRSRL